MIQCNKDGIVEKFNEKPMGGWGHGSMQDILFLNRKYSTILVVIHMLFLEKEPFEKLALDNEMYAYKHKTFWKCMDTQRDKNQLEEMWADNPKWKIW